MHSISASDCARPGASGGSSLPYVFQAPASLRIRGARNSRRSLSGSAAYRPALDYARHEGTAGSHLSVVSRAVDPFHEGLVAVFPQIRQFLSRLLDPLELEGIDSARAGAGRLPRSRGLAGAENPAPPGA